MPAIDVLGLVGNVVEPLRFEACVDSGGFGLVYRARHLQLDTEVAVKCLRVSNLGGVDEDLRQTIFNRFRDETRLLYRLSQGCLDIVRCIGSGELAAPATGEQTPYMILEWLDGYSLSHDIGRRREQDEGGRSLGEAVRLLDSAANALAFAHAQGVVHRDVKPGNLFFTKTQHGMRLKVLDFGLAKILADEGAIGMRPSAVTGVGVQICSPSYGAPEQFSPKVGPIGTWTDVYSLTLVLLEVMKGEKVRRAANLAEGVVMALDPKTGSPRPSALGFRVSRSVDDLLHRALAQNPLERPRDAGVFWSALKELVQQSGAAPTVADANVVDHMERIRAAQSAHGGGAGPSSAAKKRLAGTMVMPNSPPATHPLAPPLAAPMARPPTPAPFQSAAAYAQAQPISTARMAPYAQQQQQPFLQAPVGSVVPQSGPRSRPEPKKGGSGFLAALLVFFLIVLVGGGGIVAFWYFRMR